MMLPLLLAAALSAEAPPAVAEPEKAKRFELDVGGLLQTRYDFHTLTDEHRFSMPRARFLLKGGLPKLLEMNLGVDLGDFGARFVNAYVNIRAFEKHLQVRVGRMKRPFLRERLTSAADLVMVDRSVLAGQFGDKRDYGIMLHNGLDGSGLEWAAGLFGDYDAEDFLEDEDKPINPVMAFHLGYGMKDLDGYNDVDRKGGGLRAGGAVSALVTVDRAAVRSRETGYRLEADVLLRVAGASVSGGALLRSDEITEAAPTRIGGFGAADYFFLGRFDVGARFSVDWSETEVRQEALLGFSTWLFDDHLKLALDGAWLGHTVDGGTPADDSEFRVRLQVQVK